MTLYNFSYKIIEGPATIDIKSKEKLEKLYDDVNNPNIDGFAGVKLDTNITGRLLAIRIGENYSTFRDDEFFAVDLSKILLDGMIYLIFASDSYAYENGRHYGYLVRPNLAIPLILVPVALYAYGTGEDVDLKDPSIYKMCDSRSIVHDENDWAISLHDPYKVKNLRLPGIEEAIRNGNKEKEKRVKNHKEIKQKSLEPNLSKDE